jgi:hypothetical protein
MSEDAIEAKLKEFIYAANGCIEDDGRFARDNRYAKLMEELVMFSREKLDAIAKQLAEYAVCAADPKIRQFYERFVRDLELY